ncbi:MAG: hypothetical protein M3P18_24385 [Actinomycetota bacterium]|nr:hypothetical protein [Actinomycetota bacterium]
MERSSVAVLAIQRPRCEGRRGPRLLGCTAALLAALVCGSVFVATAQAEDLPPPASDGAALSSDPIAIDPASAAPPATSATGTGATDTATDATDTSGITTDATDPTTDALDPSTGTTGTSGTATDATDPSTGTTALDPSGGSDGRASDSHKQSGERGRSNAANGTDSVPPPSAYPPAEGGSQLPSHSASSSEQVGGSSISSSSPPEVRSESTFGATSRDDGLTTDSPLDDLSRSGAGGAGDDATVALASGVSLETGAVGLIRWRVGLRFIVVCRSPILSRAHFDPDRGLLAQWPAQVQATDAGRSRVRAGGESGRPDGSQRPRSHRSPAPDDEPPVPIAPSSGLGSGSSGGSPNGTVLGVITLLFSVIPPRNDRLVRLVERRLRALHLFFFLERPG